MKSYINAHGVHVFINPYGVLLTYSQDSEQQIEVTFSSVQHLLQKMKVASLNSITGASLMNMALTGL
jgi:hypothetical protein